MTLEEAQDAKRDLRIGSKIFSVENGNAKIRMNVDERFNLYRLDKYISLFRG